MNIIIETLYAKCWFRNAESSLSKMDKGKQKKIYQTEIAYLP